MSVDVTNEMRAKLAALGDSPILDSTFGLNRDGSQFERTQGTKGWYLSSEADGWALHGPFGLRQATPPPAVEPEPDVEPVWIGSPNFTEGRPGAPIALVVHTMGGSLAGTDSWFAYPPAQVSAHFGAGDDGQLHQYVDLGDTAWANGILEEGNRWRDVCTAAGQPGLSTRNPNGFTVSVETEDGGSAAHPVTDGEHAATLAAGRLALRRYPSIYVLTGHHVIAPRSRAGCPGTRWTSGRLQQLAEALGLVLVI